MNRHAYLIIAHNDFNILEKLIKLIDDKRNDIYLHIDVKARDFDFKLFKSLVKESNLYFIKRGNIRWGHYSQIKCEIELLKEATKKEYAYYHLISGVDFLLKTQDEIHSFFSKNQGKEFIHFCSDKQVEKIKFRIQYYHFVKYNRTANEKINRLSGLFDKYTLKLQKKLKLKRKYNENINLKYGCNWFSITHNLAKYVVKSEAWIHKHFKFTLCGDELFLQTLVYNSDFKNALYINDFNDNYEACVRHIDWNRGEPYIFRLEDFEELIESRQIFARKFSMSIDQDIIGKLYNYLSSR